ncbi:hypothetical protein L596_016567 [Steinernema carpocapsae]|uniref:Uncharacterized protein n=1 Tax=Steinernema carpocapsae TaxID=34508 RepID=A0A4U5NJ38_STECR|nr:hypothetical protein L596_016567 [Steinernema carpocapsae]
MIAKTTTEAEKLLRANAIMKAVEESKKIKNNSKLLDEDQPAQNGGCFAEDARPRRLPGCLTLHPKMRGSVALKSLQPLEAPKPTPKEPVLLGVKPSRRSSLRPWKRSASTSPSLSLHYPTALGGRPMLSDSSDSSDDEEDVEAMLLAEMKALEEDEDDFLENLLIQELKKDSSASDSDSDFDDLF